MRKKIVAMLACLTAALLLLPTMAFAQSFTPTPNATLDNNGVLHWDAEGEYYSQIDLGDLMFGPDSSDACEKPVNGEYTYDIENLFQAAEQLYGSIGDGDVSGLNGNHPVTFVYYERQSDGTMKEVGRAKDAYTYTYTTGQLVKLATPGNLSWTGDGFTASWDTVEHAEGYWVRLYETTSGGTSAVSTKTVEGNTFQLTSIVTTPKDGATYAFEVRAIGPAGDAQYVTSDWSAKSVESAAWKTPVVEYGLSVGGIDVTSENAADVLGDGTVSYDPNTQTLTLKDASIAGTSTGTGSAIESEIGKPLGLVTIEVLGVNSCGSIMLHDGCSLAITGSGKLTVAATAPAGAVSVQDNIIIDGVTLVATSKEGIIQSNLGDIIVKNGAHIDADELAGEGAYCLAANSIIIENSTVDALSEGPNSNLLWVYGDSSDLLNVENSTVTVTGNSATSPAIWAANIEVASASELKVYGGYGNAVYSDGAIKIRESTLHAENASPDAYPAIYAASDIDVTDGIVTAKSAGMRGIFTEADMTISNNSKVTASGATNEGMVVVGKLKVENSSLHASTSSDQDMMMALVTEQLEVVASDVTLEGGLDLSAWYDLSTDNASLVIEPGASELAEFKVDGQNRDGSAAVHFREEGANSPYDARAELTDAQINWLGAYRYVHIGKHVHEGGAATCARPAVCDDCGREYGAVDSDAHSFTHYASNNDATCTEDGTETAVCDNGCGATDTRTAEGSATGHSFTSYVSNGDATCTEDGTEIAACDNGCGATDTRAAEGSATGHGFVNGVCTVCGIEDPDYVEPEVPGQDTSDPQDPESPGQGDSDSDEADQGSTESGLVPDKNDPSIPATGDVGAFFSAAPALVGATAVAVGAALGRRR